MSQIHHKIKSILLGNGSFSSQLSNTHLLRYGTYSLVTAMSVYALCFICPPVQDNDSYALTGTSVASDTTLSISLSGSVLPLDLTPTSSSGTFATTVDGDTHATIRVSTNNITGYTLGIKAVNSNSDTADKLVSSIEQCENTPTSTKCSLSSLSQPVSSAEYLDNTVEGIDLNNTWGYAPSYYNSTPNTTTTTTLDPNTNEDITTTSPINYYPAPVNGDTIATTDSPNQEDTNVNDGTLLEDTYTIDFAARIDYTPYAGSYSTNYNNQSYIITAVGNPVPYSVSYDANKPQQAPAEAEVDNMPTAQTGSVTSGDTVAVILNTKVPTLGTENPTTGEYEYAGYVFNGWCTVRPEVPAEINGQTNTLGYQVCPVDQQGQQQEQQAGQTTLAQLFQPGDNFGIDQTTENTQILYATWGAPARVTFNTNGLVYEDTAITTSETINSLQYIPIYMDGKITNQRQNQAYIGTYQTPIYKETTSVPTNYIMKGWNTDPNATEATYTDEQAIINDLTLNADNNITLYAIWTYTTVITFDGNGADSGTMEPQIVEAGITALLKQNFYTNTGYVLDGWNTEIDGSGIEYEDRGNFIAPAESKNITLYAQWEVPCDANSICYLPNGANEGESDPKMSAQTIRSSIDTNYITSYVMVDLWPSNYKYDTNSDGYNDYGFVGWSEDKNAASKILDTNPDNDPTIYGPNQTITLGDVSTAGFKLYAVWMPVAKDSNDTGLTFQTTNLLTTTLADGSTLAQKPNGYVTALKDQRDNQVYAVSKLADGNYWMIENLRLDNNVIYPNWGDNSLSQGFGGVFVGLAEAEFNDFGHTTVNSLYNTGSSYTMPEYNNSNTASPAASMTTYDTNIYSLGNYYSWSAAIADTTVYATNGGHTDVDTSICPAGWQLPYGNNGTSGTNLGNTSGGFYYLNNKINSGADITDASSSKAWRTFPNNFVYSGSWGGSSASGRGHAGRYWTSAAYNPYNAFDLFFYSDYVGAGVATNSSYSGYSVRCVVVMQ